ncbi:zinc-binding dehydrogenase, partial [Streptomyces sp. NPDC058548]|uniref:zinc-binding dehydrogenase n=1 Tax=Streptomyces sp. NPDC058548 TaxID=3346545 RepID=UPI0036483D38
RGAAHVIAVARNPESAEEIRALGAHEVLASAGEAEAPVDGVLDLVGGTGLVEAYRALGEGGRLVTAGAASHEPSVFPPGALLADPLRHSRTISSFFLMSGDGIDTDLTWLAAELAAGSLRTHIAWRGAWNFVVRAQGGDRWSPSQTGMVPSEPRTK